MNIAIIGAGYGGMAAAYDLVRTGHQITIFEASQQVGGLASGFKESHWDWSVEKFYHHWFESDIHMLGLIEDDRTLQTETTSARVAQKAKAGAEPAEPPISEHMAVRAIANAWPQTRAVFEKHNLPWEDCPVPFWEPLSQSAAARGIGPTARRRLLEELNEAIGHQV